MKRIRLKNWISSTACKQIVADILSGDSVAMSATTTLESDTYIAGISGDILNNTETSVDHTFYNIGYFERDYSVENPDIIDDGVQLDMRTTDSDIIDSVQYGDYAFNLTNPTSLGTSYALQTTPSGSSWYLEPHEVVTYSPTGTSEREIDLIINNINFNITEESPDIVYGFVSGGSIVFYVNNTSTSGSVYSLSGGIPNSLPFNYVLEQPLIYNPKFARAGQAYGGTSGTTTFLYSPSGTVSGNTLYSPFANDDEDTNKLYMNPFKLKNMYNYNWDTEITRPDTLYGVRSYLKIGKTQENIWLSYKYYREDLQPIQNFQLVERIKGLYKYRPIEGHKSNIYSIRIVNSGLNEDLTNNTIKQNLREIVEETVRKAVEKIAPASTQLWKIEWSGR